MADYTEHYQLHQWVPTDDFLRTDFNTDFAKIDAAIKGVETAANTALAGKADAGATQAALETKAEIIHGSYVGNGAEAQQIQLGFKPRLVLIPADEWYSFVAMEGFYSALMSVTETGFQVKYISIYNFTPNAKGETYQYIALR